MPRYFTNKKVLITGASGFIGSHLALRLVNAGSHVAVMVRETTDLWRLREIKDSIRLCRGDLREQEQVEACVRAIRPDYVFHLGAYGVDSRERNEIQAVKTNVSGTVFLVSALLKTGCEKLLNIGSCMEYGNKAERVREDAPLEPFNIYGSTKAAGIIIAHQLAAQGGLPLVTLRAFGIFGENEGSHKFFPHIILSLLQGREVRLTGCEQFRDYCYVENLVDAFLLAAQDQACKNEIFNIGCGAIRPLKDYVEMIYAQMNCPAKPNYGAIPYRRDEVWRPHPDISKIQAVIQWAPRLSLEEGLTRTINWYRHNLDKYQGTGR